MSLTDRGANSLQSLVLRFSMTMSSHFTKNPEKDREKERKCTICGHVYWRMAKSTGMTIYLLFNFKGANRARNHLSYCRILKIKQIATLIRHQKNQEQKTRKQRTLPFPRGYTEFLFWYKKTVMPKKKIIAARLNVRINDLSRWNAGEHVPTQMLTGCT